MINKDFFSLASKLLIFLGILIPVGIIFRALFLPGSLAFGDSPYFYLENLNELYAQPLLWDFRNDNFGAPQVKVLWLYLPTFLVGTLNHFFDGNHDLWIRMVFYFPAVIFAAVGVWLYSGIFTKNTAGRFIATYLYTINTYFLMVLDGGQLGVALAYGLFPCAIFFLTKYFSSNNYGYFIAALLFVFLLINSDVRIFLLAILFYLILNLFKYVSIRNQVNFKETSLKGLLLSLAVLGLNVYWLIPFLINSGNLELSGLAANLTSNNVSIINGLFLFHPQFPLNEFGRFVMPPFYFGLLPLVLFSGLIIGTNLSKLPSRKYYLILLLMFLAFTFFVKGTNDPFGWFYSLIVNYLPFGVAFRDSTKFFIPLLLAASIMFALVIELLKDQIKNKNLFWLVLLLLYFYLSILIYPAFKGDLTGTLAIPKEDKSYLLISEKLAKEKTFFRSLYFPEKPPLGFANWQKPALSANNLYLEYPFAAMIIGDYDLFNYLHSPLLSDWFRLLGIKYVFFPEDARKKTFSDKQVVERLIFENFVNNIPGFKSLPWNIDFPGVSVEGQTKEKIFTQNKAGIVLGDAEIYQYLKDKLDFDLTNTGTLFLEDGILDIKSILNLPNNAAILLVYNRTREDLNYSFLIKNFISLKDSSFTNWGFYDANQYLKWKAELNKNSIQTNELGFKQGLIFSSIKGEKIVYKIKPYQKGNYYIAVRNIGNQGSVLKIQIADQVRTINASEQFIWNNIGPLNLENQEYSLEIENVGGFNAINTIALFDQTTLNYAQTEAHKLIEKFGFLELEQEASLKILKEELQLPAANSLQYQIINPTKYSLDLQNSEPTWVVFSDHYNQDWVIKNSQNSQSYPLYSMINGFWVDNPSSNNLTVEYKPQKIISLTLILSIISGIVILGIITYLKFKNK